MSETSTTYTWKGDLTLANVELYKHELLNLDVASELAIEFKDMGKWDIAGIQFMYALKRYFLVKDKDVSFLCIGESQAANQWIELVDTYL